MNYVKDTTAQPVRVSLAIICTTLYDFKIMERMNTGQGGMTVPMVPPLVSLLPSRSGTCFTQAEFFYFLVLSIFLPSASSLFLLHHLTLPSFIPLPLTQVESKANQAMYYSPI